MNERIDSILTEINKVISGKEDVVRKIVMSILSGGHILLDDVPGVGKTTLAVALGKTMGLKYARIQFTPDVMPSDIVGFSVYNKDTGGLEYKPGIIGDTNLLLGDEINRTSSKTQSALLEAMEEGQVTVDGNSYPLNKPFIVIATQNNVGTAGTQLLPYAQMDRFLVRLSIGYPDYNAQIELLKNRQNANPIETVHQAVALSDVIAMQNEVQAVTAKDSVLDYITRLVIESRNIEYTEIGISPRGALYIDRMAKACAYMDGRDYVIPEDVRSVIGDVCGHRIILTQKARLSGVTSKDVIEELKKSVPSPEKAR